jgi:plastocyanin
VTWKNVGQRSLLLIVGISIPAGFPSVGSQKDSPAHALASISGRLTVLDRGNKLAKDVADAVVWLEPVDRRLLPDSIPVDTTEIMMSKKAFRPHLVVVTVGSAVAFPNEDPFNHNVFSRSQIAPFDLGRYSRGKVSSTDFPRAGVIRVFCNVHARMSAIIVVRDSPYYAQPSGDGSFSIVGVPAGDYVLHAWHERAKTFRPRRVQVTSRGVGNMTVELDARDHRFVQHLNKFGQPYSKARRGRRY